MGIYTSPLLAFVGSTKDFIYVPTTDQLPLKVDLRAYSGLVENQLSINSCTANSIVSACELVLQANGQFANLSRIFNYYESRKHVGMLGSDSGVYLRDAVSAAHHMGLPLESLYPYDTTKINTVPPAEVYTDASTRLVDRYERIWDGFDYTWVDGTGNASVPNGAVSTRGSNQWVRDIKSALYQGFPLLIGFELNNSFMQLTGNFDYQAANPWRGITSLDPSQGGHAVVIVGYDDAYDAFIIENSWGSSWGHGGFALFPYSASQEMFEAWVIKSFNGLAIPSTTQEESVINVLVDPRYQIPSLPVVEEPVYYVNGVYQMAVTSSDLVWRKSKLVSLITSQNGGDMSFATTITTNVKNNLFPDVSQVERTNGSVTFRKLFLHINKNSQDELLNARVGIGAVTPAQDFVVLYAGTKTDTEDNMTATRCYGAGTLAVNADVGGVSLTVTPENEAWFTTNTPIRANDVLYISDGVNTDYITCSAVTYGATIAITCSALPHAYTSGAVVASVYEVASTKANYGAPVVSSTAGTFTHSGNIIVNNKGSIDQAWTVTFTNSTSYEVAGAVVGSVGVGTVSSDFTPSNTAVAAPYFSLKATGFGGTFQGGDTIVFSTISGSIPLWLSRVVPSGTTDISNNYCTLSLQAESY